ncbi:FISUMP domain-containing protein [Dysgonomonas sp. 25]|uniref:FISUMP domain-containing protein n=1 Tax=Dysgonomonas sp. 25 TaxID=2302933 RepID=UPI0013D8DAF7|nr:FISUMP domain-containing protein [Dysgonomonas sp. 25]NDV68971.1 hypothetical protein [Dysgonomonas sp. 25]
MKQKILTQAIIILAFLTTTINLHSQVTIGSNQVPNKGALLDLKMDSQGMSTKGLGLPRVELKDIRTKTDLAETMGLASGTLNAADHVGLVVYNIGKEETSEATRFCPGVHLWDGSEWQALTKYPDIQEQLTFVSSDGRSFEYLDASSPASDWPAGKSAADYPLGYIGTFTDSRSGDTPQVYHYARFYVGYKTKKETYNVQKSYSCNPASPIWNAGTTETRQIRVSFDDGVWMTENLRAIKFSDGGNITQKSTSDHTLSPYYHYPALQSSNRATLGVLYNWYAAINMGSGPGQTPDPGFVIEQGGSAEEDVHIQGICPTGWCLPSDQEWTDLENGIILKTATFSSTPDIGGALLSYDDSSFRGTHGTAMKTITHSGSSKTAMQGGFDAIPTGYVVNGSALGGGLSYFWSSSAHGLYSRWCWHRYLAQVPTGMERNGSTTICMFPVRCKKDD